MSLIRKIKKRTENRKLRVRSKFINSGLPRVSVFRSLKYIYAQIIDDVNQKTLASCSSLELKNLKGNKAAIAKKIGLELAKRAKTAGIEKAVFDRGCYLYHGRVQSLAEGLREGGLQL